MEKKIVTIESIETLGDYIRSWRGYWRDRLAELGMVAVAFVFAYFLMFVAYVFQ